MTRRIGATWIAGVVLPLVLGGLILMHTVDLAPAVVLATQLLFGALFGFLGLLLADSMLASLKVALQELSNYPVDDEGELPKVV